MKIQLRKKDVLLVGLITLFVAFYFVRFVQLKSTYQPNGTDEFLYYLEAKAISAYNTYQTPITFDGVTSKIGQFGIHGWGYAFVDGWLGKLFDAQNPSILISNFILLVLGLCILAGMKHLQLTDKLLIAVVLLSNHVILRYTFSYYQETIQFVFGIGLCYYLWLIYTPQLFHKKYILYYLLLVLLYTQFRYNGFLWIFGLLPMLSYRAWRWPIIIVIPVFAIYGLLSNALFVAPFPYPEAFNYVFADALKTKPMGELITWFFSHFIQNIATFLFDHESLHKLVMRYLFLGMSLLATFFAYRQKNNFLWAVSALSWVYFFSSCALQGAMYWEYDQRALAIISVAHAFALVKINKPVLTLTVLVLSCYTFWQVKTECDFTIAQSQYINASNPMPANTAENMATQLDAADKPIVEIPLELVLFNQPNKIIHFPLQTNSGQAIRYFVNRGYTNPSVEMKANCLWDLNGNFVLNYSH